MSTDRKEVAVVGLGALGLVAVKNLVEEGFKVTGFERNDYVGGLWHFSEQDCVSALPSTVVNVSKERSCFTDFPFPKDIPSYCSAVDVQRYLEDYTDQFQLRPFLRLSTTVTKVRREELSNKWIIEIEGAEELSFDRVVMASGIQGKPHIPRVPGIELFAGDVIHSKAFKNPKLFQGKRIIVAGLANTGADTIDALRDIAREIYISHSHGSIVLPRTGADGRPFDHSFTARKLVLSGLLATNVAALHERLMNKTMQVMQDKMFSMRPEWRLSPAPSIKHAVPIVSDNLVKNLSDRKVVSIPRIREVIGASTVELEDGSRVEADALIWCTGYRTDFSLLNASIDPTRNTTPRWSQSKGSRGKPLPRLYKNVFHVEHYDSLAFMGNVAFLTSVFSLYDLASMAVAQVWAGKSTLPSKQDMNAAIDVHHDWICNIAQGGPVIPGWVEGSSWLHWANAVAGTGVNENLNWAVQGWRFWWQNRELCGLLMDGLLSPHMYRLFDGKRKKWDGAEAEIRRVNDGIMGISSK